MSIVTHHLPNARKRTFGSRKIFLLSLLALILASMSIFAIVENSRGQRQWNISDVYFNPTPIKSQRQALIPAQVTAETLFKPNLLTLPSGTAPPLYDSSKFQPPGLTFGIKRDGRTPSIGQKSEVTQRSTTSGLTTPLSSTTFHVVTPRGNHNQGKTPSAEGFL